MSDITKAKPLNTRSSTADLTAADETVRATFSGGDEETGSPVLDPATANISTLSASPRTTPPPQPKSRNGYFLAGALVVIVLAVAIGVGSRNGGEETNASANTSVAAPEPSPPVDDAGAVTTQAVPEPSGPGLPAVFLDVDGALDFGGESASAPVGGTAAADPEAVVEESSAVAETSSVTNEPVVEESTAVTSAADPEPSEPGVPTVVLEVDESISVSSDDVGGDATAFKPEPEVTVGDSALLNPNLPAETVVATPPPTPPPTNEPVLPEPAVVSVIASPTMNPTVKPTPAPSDEPTPGPTAPPSERPTSEPTDPPSSKPTSEPTKSPTRKPVVQLDLSGWGNFNWSGETPAPSVSPSKSPTPEPTSEPSRKPTPEPTTKEPTPGPSASPTRKPTDAPVTAGPTDEPTPEPTDGPTSAPSKTPTASPTPEPTDSPTVSPTTAKPTDSPTPLNPYFMGDEFYTFTEDGVTLDVSKGLTVRLLAKTGSRVQFANGDESKNAWHTRTDAAGIVSMNPEDPLNSGYVYLSNSEEGDGGGGVHGLYFDVDGNVVDYRTLLSGTTDNCGGGLTPWNTWISCEEFSGGQCWQIDGVSGQAKKTVLGGGGGRYESVAVDNRIPENPVFFTTEDDEEGALRRFVAQSSGWDAVHSDGDHSFLNILGDGTFEWTEDIDVGRDSASKNFPNSEGIQVHEGKVYFMAKEMRRLLILDLETNTYEFETTGKKFYGEGDYGNQPDQNFFGPTRKYMYFTEDGGKTPGVYARYGNDGTYFTMFQGDLAEEDETVGIALSPNHKIFYAALQDHGMVYAFEREDGLPFE